MTVTNKLTIHMDDHRLVPRIEAVQGDANTRVLELTLLSGGVAWTVPADTEVSVAYDKSDGTRGWYDTLPDGTAACAVAGNVITAILAPQVLTAVGKVRVVVILRDKNGSSQLGAFPVTVLVISNPAAGSEISNDYYHYTSLGEMNQALEKMSEELARLLGYEESARQSAEEAAANAQEAEASALEAEAKAPLICTVTGSPTSGKMVCDRTMAEVWAAHQAGRYVYALHGGRVFGPVDVYETTARFGSVDGQSQYQITLIADGTVVFESISMAKAGDIPTVLPNPHALTINGAPYDGSEAVELEIPEPLICTVTGSDAAGYSCDTSWAQIREAADQGRVVLARKSYTFFYLRFITSSYAEFTHISGEYSKTLTIYSDGSAPTIETVTLAQGASTALPTPTAADAGKVPVVKEDGSGYALGNKVELIKSITIGDDAEEANSLTIDADEDGNPFELVYARLQSYFPKYTGTSEIPNVSFTMVNGYTYGAIYPAVYTRGFPVVSNAQPRSSIYVMDTRGPQLYEYGFRTNVSGELAGGNHSDSRMFYRGPENLEYFSPITSIGGTKMLIYPGCKFELWGVRR